METRLKKQRYWVLLNSKNTPVLSSLIAREKKPKTGEWIEVALRPCCTAKVAVGVYDSYPIFTITSGGKVAKIFINNIATLEECIDYLNANHNALGTWSTDGEYFILSNSPLVSPTLELIYD